MKSKYLPTDLRDEHGNILEGDDALVYMHEVFSDKFMQVDRLPDRCTGVSKDKFTVEEFCLGTLDWIKAEQNIPKNTAAGPDEISVSLMKQLGQQGKAQIFGPIEQVINTREIPTNWRKSRMNLNYNGKGDRTKQARTG